MPRREGNLPGPEQVPFQDGNLMEYAGRYRPGQTDETWGSPDEWRDNVPFEAELSLAHIERGRSAARFVWADTRGGRWPMFMVDAFGLMQTPEGVARGVVRGKWIVVKRGTNYGISPMAMWEAGMGA